MNSQTVPSGVETRALGRGTWAWVIENPTAGQADWTEQIAAAIATFREAEWEVVQHQTAKAGDATAFARQAVAQAVDIVVVAGGDGTVNEALQGLAGQRRTALAVLPGGTVNVWATELGIEKDEADIARRLVHGRRHLIDLGRVNGRYFLMMASVGIDAEVSGLVSDVPLLKRLKALAGPVAYAVSALLTAIHYRGRRVTLTIDGQVMRRRLLMLVAGNTRLYGGVAEITYQARADDGLLDVSILSGRGPLDLVRRGIAILRRQQLTASGIDYRRASQLTLNSPRPLRLQVDGEDIGTTPATFESLPQALEVVVLAGAPPGFLAAPEEAEQANPVA